MEDQVPALVRIGALLVALEAVGLLAFSLVGLAHISSDRLALGVTNAVFFVVYAVGLGLCAWGLLTLRSWCRGPIVLAQVIQLGIAWSFAGRATAWLSAVLAVPAAIVLASALAPSTTQALYGGESDDGSR